MSAKQLAGSWLVGVGAGSMALALARGNFAHLAFPFLLAATGVLLLAGSGPRPSRFPGTDLERHLDRLFALLFPTVKGTTTTATRAALAQQLQVAWLRRGTRRWARELQLITTDGYETAARIASHRVLTRAHDDQALVADAVRALGEERATAGAELTLVDDPIPLLAYGLAARPVEADLTSLDDLLGDLGLAGESDELRIHFDEILAAQSTNPHLKNAAQRRMFRDLAGASFVLGASTRILELASLAPAANTRTAGTAIHERSRS
jgi:hypothetical protein